MLGCSLDSRAYVDRLREELGRVDHGQVQRLADLLYEAWREGRFVFLFGNGGSAALASHLAEDLGKNCIPAEGAGGGEPRRLKVMSLTDNTPWLTALGNDLGYERVFVEQLAQYASPGDLAVAISGSGNSPNVLEAIQWAHRNGLVTAAITGFDGGRLKGLAQYHLHVPLDDMAMVESIHLCLGHWIIDDLYARLNRCGRYEG